MARAHSAPPGDLLYASDRKLRNLARHFGLKTVALGPDIALEGRGELELSLPPLARATLGAKAKSTRSDPDRRDSAREKLLADVCKRLDAIGLADLERGEDSIYETDWFRFRRRLRFGVGHADSDRSISAFVVVDEVKVPTNTPVPGVLLNGSVAHVLPPYADDELRNSAGRRSGSGTGHLFAWLDAARRALEEDLDVDLEMLGETQFDVSSPPRHPDTAINMYSLFARDDWLRPQLLNGAYCEGIAQASLIAPGDDLTVVLGSPLFLRICKQTEDESAATGPDRQTNVWGRLFGRSHS